MIVVGFNNFTKLAFFSVELTLVIFLPVTDNQNRYRLRFFATNFKTGGNLSECFYKNFKRF